MGENLGDLYDYESIITVDRAGSVAVRQPYDNWGVRARDNVVIIGIDSASFIHILRGETA